jgi:hypothetical protein
MGHKKSKKSVPFQIIEIEYGSDGDTDQKSQ